MSTTENTPDIPDVREHPQASISVRITPEPILVRSGTEAVRIYSDFINVGLTSAQSSRTYRSVTRSFFIWCDDQNLEELVDVEPHHIKSYLIHRDVELGKGGSVATHFAAVRSMFHAFVANGYLQSNPAASVKYQIPKGREGDYDWHSGAAEQTTTRPLHLSSSRMAF